MKKSFIITIDTEGDNLWKWKVGDVVRTENVKYLARFQTLANTYGFKPVWLSNYEMIADDAYVEFAKTITKDNSGEIGMHLHAWNSPPLYELPVAQNGAPYLIEYPEEVMEEKIYYMTNFITKRVGIQPISHRAGRWAMNDTYFSLLKKYGYKVDCSVTPHIDWRTSLGQTQGAKGTDYRHYPEEPYYIDEDKDLLEVPVTVRRIKKFYLPKRLTPRSIAGIVWRRINGQSLWIRPNGYNFHQMKDVIDRVVQSNSDYAMFMIHSSELMPGGSPTFPNEQSIEQLYNDLEKLFAYASQFFNGRTLAEYAKTKFHTDGLMHEKK